MGQYYRAVLYKEPDWGVVLDPWQYDNGAKLMEHSYFGNQVVGTACRLLKEEPRYTWWVGDYYHKQDVPKRYEKFDPTGAAWGNGVSNKTDFVCSPYQGEPNEAFCNTGILVNLTTQEFVNLDKLAAVMCDHPYDSVHPLPLLTAAGNGRGGGDYRGDDNSMKMVGIWAGDLLQIVDDESTLEGYADITSDICFKAFC